MDNGELRPQVSKVEAILRSPKPRTKEYQMLPVGSPFQDIVLTAQLHKNPETSLERLVPLVEI